MKKKTRDKLENDLKECDQKLLNNNFDPETLYKKANILFSLKQYRKSLKIYDLLLEKAPENPNLWVKKAYTLFKIEGFEERNNLDFIETLVLYMQNESVDNVNEDLNKALDVSVKLMKNKSIDHMKFFESIREYEEAGKILYTILCSIGRGKQAFEADQTFIKIYRAMEKSRIESENKSRTIWYYNKMLNENDNDADSWYNIGRRLERVNEPEIAEKAYERAANKMLSENDNNADSWYNIGRRLEGVNEPEIAEKAYERAAQLYYEKGEDSIKNHLYENAYDSFKIVLKLKPELYSAWAKCGYVLIKQGKLKGAICNCERALELNCKCAEAWYFRSVALAKLQMYDDSLISYDKTLEINPEFVEALNGKGMVLVEIQHYDEALKYYEKAINLKFDHPVLWYNKCFALRKLSRYEEALEACEKSLTMKPNYYKALCNKAYILEKLNRNEESKLAYTQAANLFYELGNHYYQSRAFNKATKFYDGTLKIIPTHISALNKKGSALAKQGRIKDALILIDNALDINSKCAESWFIKSEIYYLDEDIKKALECYEKAIQLDQNVINLNPLLGKKISDYHMSNKNITYTDIKTKKGKDESIKNWYDENNSINRYGLYK